MPAVKPVPRPPPAEPRPNRMTLQSVTKGKLQQPVRVVLYGVEGIGKSTFGANAPAPIFLGAEDGTAHLDVARFPKPERLEDVFDAVRTLTDEQHDYQTLVLDSLDWLEPLVWRYVCERDGQPNIEAYGYGKGYQTALDEWLKVLAAFERVRASKRMHIVLIAHSVVKTFKNPEGEDFDRYEMKLHSKAAGLVKEWSDCVLFANYETYSKRDDRTKRVKGIATGARLLFTNRRAAFDAKNRYSLPEELPLSWEDFSTAVQSGQPANPKALTEEIQRKAKELGGDTEQKILEYVAKAGGDASRLAQINNRVNALLAEKEQQ